MHGTLIKNNERGPGGRERPARPCRAMLAWVSVLLAAGGAARATADDSQYEQDPILYSNEQVDDPVARLAARIKAGEVELEFDDNHGWLRSLLARLDVPVESQTLVFSKTSFQRDRISPATPRAIYFNDDVYIGWVQQGEVVEISAVDPQKGAIFYTLQQSAAGGPQFKRQTHDCLQCHDGFHSQRVPGHIMRSVHVDERGQIVLNAGSHATNDQSAFHDRFGGWYVTGMPAGAPHLGNRVLTHDAAAQAHLPGRESFAASPLPLCNTRPYLANSSDVVALLILGHQATLHNLLTRANYQTRLALRDERAINQALGRPLDHRLESTSSRIAGAADALARGLLFANEAPLPECLTASGTFAQTFSRRGPVDRRGRSLREFDLRRRMFRYPLSFLIYSRSFDALPAPMKQHVYQRLWQVLTSESPLPGFPHYAAEERRAIIEILQETLPDLPHSWRN